MKLLKNMGITVDTDNYVEFEKMAEDLLLIKINNDIRNQAGIFNHWRLRGNGQNPPLDIRIDIYKTTIHSITVFIDANNFIDVNNFTNVTLVNTIIRKGNVLLNSNLFENNRYVTNGGLYYVFLDDRTLTFILNDIVDIKERVQNGRIEYLITNNDELGGFSICNLDSKELDMINSLQIE